VAIYPRIDRRCNIFDAAAPMHQMHQKYLDMGHGRVYVTTDRCAKTL
jgi:hypothetical protein